LGKSLPQATITVKGLEWLKKINEILDEKMTSETQRVRTIAPAPLSPESL